MSADSQKEIMDPPNKRQTLSRLVVETAQKFRIKPSQEYLGNVVNFLDCSLKLHEAERLLRALPKNYDTFPSLSQIEENIPTYREKQKLKEISQVPWVSKKAPGTPASVEALFNMIQEGKSDSGAFRVGLQRTRLTEQQLWCWYESWCDGKIHPELQKRRESLLKPWAEALAERGLK